MTSCHKKKVVVCWQLKCLQACSSFIFSLAFLISRYGFESYSESRGHKAEHVSLRGNELKQRGRAVMWAGMQFGVASQTSPYTHIRTSLFLFVSAFPLLPRGTLQWKHTSEAYIWCISTFTLRRADLTLLTVLQTFTFRRETMQRVGPRPEEVMDFRCDCTINKKVFAADKSL